MNRRHSDRISDDHDISKQRIVRHKIHRSPSPPLSRHSHREVRTSNSGGGGDMYSKMSNSSSSGHRSHKFGVEFRHSSSADFRDDHLGRNKERRYGRERDELDNDGGDSRGGRRRSRTSDVGNRDTPPIPPFFDNYKYSLHVANISSKLTEGEAKMQLFRDFKRFGYVNIKVIGFGKDRHAFINFTREDEAREALNEMNHSVFFGQSLEVTWSRATLNQHPELLAESQGSGASGDRRNNSKGHSYHSNSGSGGVGSSPIDFYPQSGRGSYRRDSSPHQSIPRDISYLNISPEPSPRSSSGRNYSLHSSKDIPAAKSSSGPITDPNATRTLFVGNLEADVTERELRDLFGPYGRIESVDIKVQRPISTAYAFVKFFTITDAMNAKKDMHGRKYGNVKLKIGFGKGSPSAKVWVGNLSSRADLSEIRGELDRFGLIRRVDYTDGDSHAFVHFDSLDAAQTAVDSLTTYRFRNTNRPLKIDVSQPVRHSPGSDYEDFDEPEYHNSVMSGSGSRRVHSHLSPEHKSLSPIRRNRVEIGGAGDGFSRHLSRNDDNMDLMMSSMKGSFHTSSSSRGRRVVTEVRDSSSHARQSSYDDSFSHRDAGGFRKRARSPNFGDDLDLGDYGNRGFRGRRRSRGNSIVSNGSQRAGHSNNNGDFDYRAKRPRNGFDAYQYHKLHGNRTSFDNSTSGNYSGVYDRERDRDRSSERDRDNRGSRRSSRDRASSSRRSSSVRRDHRTRSDDRDRDHDRDGQRSQKGSVSSSNAELKAEIEKISPPPPPPPPPMTDMMSYEAADSALKLNDSSGQASSADGVPGLSGLNADSKIDTLADMSRVYPVIWRGNLVLKNTGFPTRMHLVGGDPAVAELLVKSKEPGGEESDALRITQRLRLDPPRLDEVNKRMASAGHCILLALPGAIPSLDEEGQASNSATQLRPLKSLVSYLEQKEAAGIVALNGGEGGGVALPGGGTVQLKESIVGVLHAFPPCQFSHNQLRKIAPNLGEEPSKEDHVVVLLVKGTV